MTTYRAPQVDVLQVVRVAYPMGDGTKADPVREVVRYHALDGRQLAEVDSHRTVVTPHRDDPHRYSQLLKQDPPLMVVRHSPEHGSYIDIPSWVVAAFVLSGVLMFLLGVWFGASA